MIALLASRQGGSLLKTLACLVRIIAVLWAAPAVVSAGDWHPRPELLVTTAWLTERQDAAELRVVDLREVDAYAAGHIPNAVHLPAQTLFASVNGVEGMLPPLPELEANLGRLGLRPNQTVVAYDDASGLYAARLFWVLEYLGHADVRVLDGGWPAWVREGRSVSRAAHMLDRRPIATNPNPALLADLNWVRTHLSDPSVVLVDARSTLEYRGITRYARYGGHIPGAVSMEWKRHLKGDGTMRAAAELQAIYKELGVTPEREAVVYCQVMVRAAHSYFTLRWLGHPKVRAYDGSWAEWGNLDDTPKERY